ncbi:MAG: hypothetical protein R6W70_03275 [bacterium]
MEIEIVKDNISEKAVSVFFSDSNLNKNIRQLLVEAVAWHGGIYVFNRKLPLSDDIWISLWKPSGEKELFELCFGVFARQPSFIEPDIVRFMIVLTSHFGFKKQKVVEMTISAMGKKFRSQKEFYLKVMNLPEETKEIFLRGRISFRLLTENAESKEEKGIVCSLARCCSGTPSQFSDIMELMKDISLREGLSLKELMREELNPLKEKYANPRKLTKMFVFALKKRRFPFMTSLEMRFRKKSENIRQKTGVEVKPPDFFEGSHMDLFFRVENIEEFQRLIDGLKKNKGDFISLLNIVRSEDDRY